MIREGKKCVVYVRVSTEMQVDGYSLDAQKSVLKRYADREGMLVLDIYEDAGKSGKNIEGRPAFKKMLSDIKKGLDIDYILVYKLSRFGRNATDILTSLSVIQSYDVNLICAEDGIDSSQTSGRLLISVLSSVAEIERENILEQTMNVRKEKARQGKWNGGNAPYGYELETKSDGRKRLVVVEDEAEIIKIIFDKFAYTNMGFTTIARYLNVKGVKKKTKTNGRTVLWTSSSIKWIIDNPVYYGKIAYGRIKTEKIKGSNDTKRVKADDYILVDGEHEAIITEEVWELAKCKRERTGIKSECKVGRPKTHLLTGILKCPVCGNTMYTNKNSWVNKKTGYKEVFYYICGGAKGERGYHCGYTKAVKKEILEKEVIDAVKELVNNPIFAEEIKKRISIQIDTDEIDKEISEYITSLKEVETNKRTLEYSIDTLPSDTKHRDRKLADMNYRLDKLYDIIYQLEENIEDAQLRKKSVEMQSITLDNIYAILKNFNKVFDKITDEEKKMVITSLIKEIQIFEKDTAPQNLKSITFNFPIFANGEEINEILWENEMSDWTYDLFSHKKIDSYIEVIMDFNDIYLNKIS